MIDFLLNKSTLNGYESYWPNRIMILENMRNSDPPLIKVAFEKNQVQRIVALDNAFIFLID